MKKLLCLLFAVVLLVLSAGCGSESTANTSQVSPAAGANPASPAALLTTTSPTSAATPASTAATSASAAPTPSKVDVDLSKLTTTMIYAELQNIMTEPEQYIGKVFKAQGPLSVYHDEMNDNYFFAVIFRDATACCNQFLEFVWAGDHKYPDDYPELGTEVVVTGTFHDYMDGDQLLYHLENASMVLANA